VKPFFATLFFVSASALMFAGILWSHMFFPGYQNAEVVEIRIDPGESFSAVVRKLRDRKIITNERLFSLWARFSGTERKIHWGLYRFESPLAPREVLQRMVIGKGLLSRITIPEGLTVREMAELLAKSQVVEKERFLEEASNSELLSSLGLLERGIEGYLFPDTYHFAPLLTARDIIITMNEQFRRVVEPLMEQKDREIKLTPHEIITLASIIEKESAIEAERPLISAVFHNRLKLSMPLQSDPTVIYGLKNFNGNLTRRDLLTLTPYNTYRIPALPPGPICNPSLSSLKAALYPASVPYLYFVSKNDGSHLFSESLEAHKRAVKLYQSGARNSAGK